MSKTGQTPGRHRIITIGMLGLTSMLWVAVVDGAEFSGVGEKVGVEPEIVSYQPAQQVSGRMTIAGSDTMQPILVRLATEFKRWYPGAQFAVQGGGTNYALQALLQGIGASRRGDGNVKGHLGSNRPVLLASSRPLEEKEHQEFLARYGYEPTEIPIALSAVALYVHRDNPIQGLTLEQVDAMFGISKKRGAQENITTWGQLGLKQGWEQQPIRLYGRDQNSGTRSFFKHAALLDGEFKSEVHEQPGSASEVLAIGRDPLGIGYAGIGFQISAVRALPIAEKAGQAFGAPSAEGVTKGTYPLSRYLYLYVNMKQDEALKPLILEFLKFINSREGQMSVIKAGVFPLPATQVAKNLATLTGSTMTTAATVTQGTN